MKKHYFLHLPLSIDKNKNERFVVECDTLPTINQSMFSGRVVARGKKSYWYLNEESNNWVNPILEISQGCQPCFIPIHVDRVKEMFEEHCL